MTDGISHPYKVVLRGAMPALAWIWLRNNQVDYDILYRFEYNHDEEIQGEIAEIYFADSQQAHWFALKWAR